MKVEVIYSGDTKECILHYGQGLPRGGIAAKRARLPMALFVGLSLD